MLILETATDTVLKANSNLSVQPHLTDSNSGTLTQTDFLYLHAPKSQHILEPAVSFSSCQHSV